MKRPARLATLAATSVLALSGAGVAYACPGKDGAGAGNYPTDASGDYPTDTTTTTTDTTTATAASSTRSARRARTRARARARARAAAANNS